MTKILLLLPLAFYLVVVQASYINPKNLDPMPAIVNGYNAPNRPFYVKLSISNTWLCGGTIISTRYVLTAAHCVQSSTDVLVFVGDFTKPGDVNKEVIRGARVKVHEDYNGKVTTNDIALIELSTTVSVNNVLPLCDRSYSSNTIAVCGMGTTNPSNNQMPLVLQEVQLKERASCAMVWNGPKKQVCLGEVAKDSCFGDSGGPAYPMDQSSNPICLYGIVSYGSNTCNGDGVYTRVSAYHDWIQKNTQ